MRPDRRIRLTLLNVASNIRNYDRRRAPDSRDNRSDSLSVLLL